MDIVDLKTRMSKDEILKQLLDMKPDAVIVDSIDDFSVMKAKFKEEVIKVFFDCPRHEDFFMIHDMIFSTEYWLLVMGEDSEILYVA